MNRPKPTRRQLLTGVGGLVLLAVTRRAWAGVPQLGQSLGALATDVRAGRISPQAWQAAIEQRLGTADLPTLLAHFDLDRLLEGVEWPRRGSAIVPVALPGLASPRVKLFAHRRGRAVPPHVHNGMVSAHLVVSGAFRARLFERVLAEEEANARVALRPSVDRTVGVGDVVTMSDIRHNGHWLHAETDRAVTLDCPITELPDSVAWPSKANRYSSIFVDPTGEPGADGLVRAPIIDVEQALARFG